jgi:hypothetical protein
VGPGCLTRAIWTWKQLPQTARHSRPSTSHCVVQFRHRQLDTFALQLPLQQVNPKNDAGMADLTTAFNALLKGHEAPPTRSFSIDTADEFLKEAYRIVRPPCLLPVPNAIRLTDVLRPRTPLLRDCIPNCAICVRRISRLRLRAKHTCGPPHPVLRLHNMLLSRTGTARRSTPMRR